MDVLRSESKHPQGQAGMQQDAAKLQKEQQGRLQQRLTRDAETRARECYDTPDAELFYSNVWGGENIHVGMYNTTRDIADASHRTNMRLAPMLEPLDASSAVLDLGSGYGGTARYLARTYGCKVTGLNVSDVENKRAVALNKQHGLQDKVEIVLGTFEDVDMPNASFDAIFSQEAMLHAGDKANVVAEAARMLKPGGRFVFTDVMRSDDCDESKLQPIYDRLHLPSLASPSFYRAAAAKHGLDEIGFEEDTANFTAHYSRVREDLIAREQELRQQNISEAYLDRMKNGLLHWVAGGRNGLLCWGFFSFRKPAK
ncbi:methyltransferase type 11 [Salpingoeca rosetta]|uniref:Methyltransferase type 11 n=1 Tax=Salpingoeca rosetta (strain ATCC 50818 / BSB-021) TaxID=946362 RepID=F2UL79_SALR5|nr:methyltransferase type 11 [Salpingoeca rosetta]EGD77878.1 methyltransferase type 11 [Salpingoeca rosetta]|eukprot:XP_004989942.1 methyltransferase type 11 [Salpingoeca rosetta]